MDKRDLLAFKQQPAGFRQSAMLAGIAIMIVAAVVSEANVYLRWGAAGNMARFVAGIGGKLAYKAEMTVNGKDASISVYGLPSSRRSWVNSVRSISYHGEDERTSLTGLTLSGTPLLFQYQRRTAGGTAQTDPSLLPRFPQSTPAFHAHNKNTDMHISISRSQAAPAQVRSFYRENMRAAGWHMPVSSNQARSEGMTVFIREQEVVCVGVEQVHNRTETRITLLHKRLGIQ